MNALSTPELFVALVHHPVVNKNGEEIASAVTNLDLHDMARSCRTFGVRRFFVVTPLEDQKRLVERITGHWTQGCGATHNPDRKKALDIISVCHDMAEVRDRVAAHSGMDPKVVVTTANQHKKAVGYGAFRKQISDGTPYILSFGTAWGLSSAFMDAADIVLDPVLGPTTYNHLSVRSATAIILDRLVGKSGER